MPEEAKVKTLESNDAAVSQRDVEESEERFRAAIDAMEGVLWTNNAQGRMEGPQPGWGRLTGQTEEEYQGYGWAKAIHPEDSQPTIDAWDEAVRLKQKFLFEHRVRRHDGEYRLFAVRAIPLFKSDHSLREWVGVHTDITDQRLAADKLQKSESRFQRLILHASAAIVVVTGKDMSVEIVNEAYGRLIGRSIDEILGRPLFQILPHAEATYRPIFEKVFTSGELITLEEVPYGIMKGGQLVESFLHIVYQPYINEHGEKLGVVAIMQDISETVRSRSALQESEQRLRQLSEQLEKAIELRTEQLKRSNEDLQQFAHVTSHDLKEPVRKVMLYTSRLRQTAGNELSQEPTVFLDKIQSSAERMYNMINGILAYSMDTSLPVHRKEVHLQQIMEAIESDLELAIAQKHAQLVYKSLPLIDADPVHIHQLLYNLITNALKFVRAGVPPMVKVEAVRTDDQVVIVVSDNGIGFDNARAEYIFQTFARLNSKHQYEGTGLGLSLCKKIVERHGGTISAEGVPGQGARFTITLPNSYMQTVPVGTV